MGKETAGEVERPRVRVTTDPAHVPAGAPFRSIQRQPPERIFELLFGRCRDNGVIALGARRPNLEGDVAIRYFYPMTVSTWQHELPGLLSFRPEWTKYVSLNTLRRRCLMGRPHEQFIEKLKATEGRVPYMFRKKDHHVRELNAIWIDLDVYNNKEGLTNSIAFAEVMRRIAEDILLWPSLIAYSGKGSYYVWLLKDHENSIEPPLVDDVNGHLWRQVIDETIKRTTDLESDPNVKSMTNWLKAPGTTDTKTDQEVMYMTVGAGGPFNIPSYTLTELAQHYQLLPALPETPGAPVQLPAPRPLPALPRPRKKKSAGPRRGGNAAAPYRARYMDVERIAQARGGVSEGRRDISLLYYFYAVRACLRMTCNPEEAHAQAQERMLAFNAKYCRPPLPRTEALKCAPMKRHKWEATTDRLVRVLHVTRQEAEELDLVALRPAELREEERRRREELKQTRERTRALIRAGIEARKSNTRIIHELLHRHGLVVKRQNIDYWRHRGKRLAPRQEELYREI